MNHFQTAPVEIRRPDVEDQKNRAVRYSELAADRFQGLWQD
jgi:hypothetical protein